MSTPGEKYIAALQEGQSEFKTACLNLRSTFPLEDVKAKTKSAKECLDKIDRLRGLLAAEHRPDWLNALHNALQRYVNNHSPQNAQSLLGELIQHGDKAARHSWVEDDLIEATGIDFDAKFKHYRSEGQITELFDRLVSQIDEIIESGQIEHITVLNALEKMAATLRRNRMASMDGMQKAYAFTSTLFKNLVIEYAKAVPGVGPSISAIEKTLDETESELTKVSNLIGCDVAEEEERIRFRIVERSRLLLPAPDGDSVSDDEGDSEE